MSRDQDFSECLDPQADPSHVGRSMTLPRRPVAKLGPAPTSPQVRTLVDGNQADFEEIAQRVTSELESCVPPADKDVVVRTVLYRLGKRFSECNDRIIQICSQSNEAALEEPPKKKACRTTGSNVEPMKKWFLEHLNYPYPTNEEKAVMAKESGQSVRQVSNWFINIRMRVWTPLVKSYGIVLVENGGPFARERHVLPDDAVQEILGHFKRNEP